MKVAADRCVYVYGESPCVSRSAGEVKGKA